MNSPIVVRLGSWDQLGHEAGAIRHKVFVLEQKVPIELELDEHDATAVHALALKDKVPVGTGRLLPDSHIGRMAVLKPHRSIGVGKILLAALVEEAVRRGDSQVALAAQWHARGFYESLGFEPEGELFMDAGIPHVLMRKLLR